MANDNISTETNANAYGIQNTELATITNQILGYAANMRLYGLIICSKVAYLRDNAETLLTEFDNSIEKYGLEVLGLKKAQTQAMAKTGKYYLDNEGNCILPEPDGVRFNKTQLQAMLPLLGSGKQLDTKLAYQLTEEGTITPEMTVTEIKQVVAEKRPDAAMREATAKKREDAKVSKEKAAKETERALYGEVLATFELRQTNDGKLHVWINDGKQNAEILKAASLAKSLYSKISK